MIKAINFMGDKIEKPYKGFLRDAKPGSTVDAGRNIITRNDVAYAKKNHITITDSFMDRSIHGGVSFKNLKDNLKSIFNSIASNLKKALRTHK